MSIVTDGVRSAKRIYLAKKLLRELDQLGLPSGRKMEEGFTARAICVGDIKKVRIQAPDGAVVICSQPSGMTIVSSEIWNSEFLPAQSIRTLDGPALGFDNDVGVLPSYEAPNQPYVPTTTTSYYGTAGTEYNDTVPTPSIVSAAGEIYWVTVSSGPCSYVARLSESFLNIYFGSGDYAKRVDAFYTVTSGEPGSTGLTWYLTTQHVVAKSLRSVVHSIGKYAYDPDYNLICATAFTGQPGYFGYDFFYGATMFAGLPADYRSAMLVYPLSPVLSIGNYAFALSENDQPTLLHCGYTCELLLYSVHNLSSNPDEAPWEVFFSLYTLGADSVASYPANVSVLAAICPTTTFVNEAGVNYDAVRQMMAQLFPWPNFQSEAPYDSAMFHAEDGAVYTWTRKYGAVRFSTAGMEVASISVPDLVDSTVGLRPEITYVSAGVYLCVAFHPGPDDWVGVRGVFLGSPFSAWNALPVVPIGYTLLKIRLVSASSDLVLIFGVLLDDSGTYNLGYLNYTVSTNTGDWLILGSLPLSVDDPNLATWALGIYGDGTLAQSQRGITAPAALPQMPVGPYALYAETMP